jgi:putative membrane protein
VKSANFTAKTKGPRRTMAHWNVLEKTAMAAFVFWALAGLIFTLYHVTPGTVARWPITGGLRAFIESCLRNGDPILILLAVINTHLHAVRQWSEGVARRWGLIILVCSYGFEYCGATTGFPFGAYHYTDNFGPMLGAVPLTIPLAWHVVVTNALFVVRVVLPHASQLIEAMLAGALCTLYDFILEPFATTLKHYWVWHEATVPPLNYVAWFVLSILLIRFFAPTVSTRYRLDPRPWLILGFTVAIFIAGALK